MDAVAITIGTSWALVGLIIIGLAIPLMRGQVPRNGLYGIRLPESLKSDQAWFAINRFGGKRMLICAFPLIAVGICSFFLPLQSHNGLTLILGLAPFIFVLTPVAQAWRFARHYGRGL